MNVAVPTGHTAVRAQKRPRVSDGQPWQQHELFPTPPWATRALLTAVLPKLGVTGFLGLIWEPACGLGHMSAVLAERSSEILATDIFQFGAAEYVHDFVDDQSFEGDADWIITNPPFGLAEAFLLKALDIARHGVALLMRTQWFESDGRYNRVFRHNPPTLVAQFAERVAMCEGGWDPACSTATAYAWFIWLRREDGTWIAPGAKQARSCDPLADEPVFLDMMLIPPGQKRALTRASDRALAARFVPGFVPPSTLRRSGKAQASMLDVRAAAE